MTDLVQTTIPSPLGALTLIMAGEAIVLCEFADKQQRIAKYLAKFYAGTPITIATEKDHLFTPIKAAFAAYFKGNGAALEGLKMKCHASGSAFDQRVWVALRTIPNGETWSYKQLAEVVGSHPRAVGGANGRNPIALITPCHRVIGKNGSLTGYAGGLIRKKWLLEMEK